MSAETAKRKERTRTTAREVEAYLQKHPEFFKHHLALLETLTIPHPCGDAVSLITRHIQILRERDQRLQQQMAEILQVARDNEALRERLHHLTLTLIDARSLEDALAGLKWGLHEYFQADFVAVRIAEPMFDSPIANLALSGDTPLWGLALADGDPHCLSLAPHEGGSLFGAHGGEAASCAFVPLRHAGFKGVLAIGSRNPKRYQPGLGSFFLAQMGEIVSARLAALIPD
ncbi:hypothetical protein SAMN02949497_2666 [Methylomagnum ishizawai]|uniref:DUF484 domain-containing protein n=1 Tax=Methylomagnum ishizawai TaxID=1760988 RepID=A0A1Y6CYD5_9GAMM|nr:DUF484 family protein [Methylomagnum ishizawai]SMF95306.1 hypothetical protein SAMN02949497_2666 [Methylomagnum ishizawai]